jgi:hypothetical protein
MTVVFAYLWICYDDIKTRTYLIPRFLAKASDDASHKIDAKIKMSGFCQ